MLMRRRRCELCSRRAVPRELPEPRGAGRAQERGHRHRGGVRPVHHAHADAAHGHATPGRTGSAHRGGCTRLSRRARRKHEHEHTLALLLGRRERLPKVALWSLGAGGFRRAPKGRAPWRPSSQPRYGRRACAWGCTRAHTVRPERPCGLPGVGNESEAHILDALPWGRSRQRAA